MLEREPISKFVDCSHCIKRAVCMYKEKYETETVEVPVFPFLKVSLHCTEFKEDSFSPLIKR